MRFLVYAGITVVLAAGCGAWLRWASRPVLPAFGAGMRVERIKRHEGRLRRGQLVAMAWHGRRSHLNVLAVKAGTAVSGPAHDHGEAA